MLKRLLLAALFLIAGTVIGDARFFTKGGQSAPSSSGLICGTGSVCAFFQNGQTYVTWPDAATGATGGNFRYNAYRSTSPLNIGNFASGTLFASYIGNNSAQLFGGDPSTLNGTTFTQANRQDPAGVMSIIPGTPTPAVYTGVQAYTALGSATAYYAIASTDTGGGTVTFIGATGPVSESSATIKPTLFAHRTSGSGAVTCGTSCPYPIVFNLHASSSSGGCAGFCSLGDYWQWWLTTEESWQDGRETTLSVRQDSLPGETHSLLVAPRDTVWNSAVTGAQETYHQGMGYTPNPLVSPTGNRLFLGTALGYKKMINWVAANYGADLNQVYCQGTSMGAWGSVNTCLRMTSPHISAVFPNFPNWRIDHTDSISWPGTAWGNFPFLATVAALPNPLGTVATAVLLSTGATWGGTNNYADQPSFMAANPGTDVPVVIAATTKNDSASTWADHLTAINDMITGKRGYAYAWAQGVHETTFPILAPLDCDATAPITTTCYHKAVFTLNHSYLAFQNDSIDDDPGNGGTFANGQYNGDFVGVKNAGFAWTISTDTASNYNFTLSNNWMTRSATPAPLTTLTSSIASSGTATFTIACPSTPATQSTTNNHYLLVGGTGSTGEVISITSIGTCTAGNATVTPVIRGQLGTTAQAHSSSDSVQQFIESPSGPNGGAVSSMTVDVIPRRRQGFLPTTGKIVTCSVTPFGGGTTTPTATVDADGNFDLTSFPINSGGVTTVTCTHN